MENFKIDVEAPVELSPEHLKGVQDAVEHCLVKNTLLHPPKISLQIDCPVAAKK
jgi:hypothetical protein